MKTLASLALAMLLATGGPAALADRDKDRDDGGYRRGFDREHWMPLPQHPGVLPGPPGARVFQQPGHDRYDYDPLDAALIGAAILYGPYPRYAPNHIPNYIPRYNPDYSPPAADGREIVSCYRIERAPDGSERLVELPVSVCQ